MIGITVNEDLESDKAFSIRMVIKVYDLEYQYEEVYTEGEERERILDKQKRAHKLLWSLIENWCD